jgi:hypothetical protein
LSSFGSFWQRTNLRSHSNEPLSYNLFNRK